MAAGIVRFRRSIGLLVVRRQVAAGPFRHGPDKPGHDDKDVAPDYDSRQGEALYRKD
jgi:hypothetical protein